jgi:hypothetical protein
MRAILGIRLTVSVARKCLELLQGELMTDLVKRNFLVSTTIKTPLTDACEFGNNRASSTCIPATLRMDA